MKTIHFTLHFDRQQDGLEKWTKCFERLFEEFPTLIKKSDFYNEMENHQITPQKLAKELVKEINSPLAQSLLYSRAIVITQSKKDLFLLDDFVRKYKLEENVIYRDIHNNKYFNINEILLP